MKCWSARSKRRRVNGPARSAGFRGSRQFLARSAPLLGLSRSFFQIAAYGPPFHLFLQKKAGAFGQPFCLTTVPVAACFAAEAAIASVFTFTFICFCVRSSGFG